MTIFFVQASLNSVAKFETLNEDTEFILGKIKATEGIHVGKTSLQP